MKKTHGLLVCFYQNKVLEACTRLTAQKEKRFRVKQIRTSEKNLEKRWHNNILFPLTHPSHGSQWKLTSGREKLGVNSF